MTKGLIYNFYNRFFTIFFPITLSTVYNKSAAAEHINTYKINRNHGLAWKNLVLLVFLSGCLFSKILWNKSKVKERNARLSLIHNIKIPIRIKYTQKLASNK